MALFITTKRQNIFISILASNGKLKGGEVYPIQLEELQSLAESKFSWLVLSFECILFSLALVPICLRDSPEEHLIKIKGHLARMIKHEALIDYNTTFEIDLKEYPKKSFLAGGIRAPDQAILTSIEKLGNPFYLSVNDVEFEEKNSDIHIYYMSSDFNAYLASEGSLNDPRKSRQFVIISAIIAMLFGLQVFSKSRKEFLAIPPTPLDRIDPLLVLAANYPNVAAGFLSAALASSLMISFPGPVSWVTSLLIALAYLVYYFRHGEAVIADPWLQSILRRDLERRERLAQKLVTAVPKHVKAVQILLKHGANVDIVNKQGKTPLLIAAQAGQIEAITLLLKHCANIDHADNQGTTALMIAADRGDLAMLTELIKNKCNVGLRNKLGLTASQIAEKSLKRNQSLIDLLNKAEDKQTKK